MSFQYIANLNIGGKYANICRIADKTAYFMSIQLFTPTVLMWLGKSIVWTVRQNNNRKKTTGIWMRQRTEQIALFSAEDKGPLSGRACHCMGGTAAAAPDMYPHSWHTYARVHGVHFDWWETGADARKVKYG